MKLELLILTFFMCIFAMGQGLNIHPIPKEILYSHHNDDFTVHVRLSGGDW